MPRLAATADVQLTTDPRLDTLLGAYLDIQATVKKLMEEQKELQGEMKALAFKAHKKGKALETDTHIVRYIEATSADSVDKAKLMKLLTAKQIAACTKPGTPYTYVGIYPKKEEPTPTTKETRR